MVNHGIGKRLIVRIAHVFGFRYGIVNDMVGHQITIDAYTTTLLSSG
jgi:hypothetical protein